MVTGGNQALQSQSSMVVQMADRDCSRVSDAAPPSKQRASTTSLPRRRSATGSRSHLSAAAQAAQNGYFQRKAAKAMLERRRAAAAAATSPEGADVCKPVDQNVQNSHISSSSSSSSVQPGILSSSNWVEVERRKRVPKSLSVSKLDKHTPATPSSTVVEGKPSSASSTASSSSSPDRVISVTVDADGVRIVNGRRRAAHDHPSVMEKENGPLCTSSSSLNHSSATATATAAAAAAGGGAGADHRDAFFAARRRRSQKEWKKTTQQSAAVAVPSLCDEPVALANLDEWDGSMPRRHSSRSFKDRAGTPRASASAVAAVRRALETANASVIPAGASAPATTDQARSSSTMPSSPAIRPLQSSTPPRSPSGTSHGHLDDTFHINAAAVSPDTIAHCERQCDESDSAGLIAAPPPQTDEAQPDSAAPSAPQGCRGCQKFVAECDKCADVASFLAKVVADVDRMRAAGAAESSAAGAEASSRAGGWRSVVLGDNGKAKLAAENTRLSSENQALLDALSKLKARFLPDVEGRDRDEFNDV